MNLSIISFITELSNINKEKNVFSTPRYIDEDSQYLSKLSDAYEKIEEQTEALISMIGDNQIDYRFFIGFKLLLNEQELTIKNINKDMITWFTNYADAERYVEGKEYFEDKYYEIRIVSQTRFEIWDKEVK